MADLETLYQDNFQSVYRYMLALCQDEAIAEEITQETFYKAMESIDRFKGECKLFVWLCQIAKHTYFSHYQGQKRCPPAADIPPQPTDATDLAAYLTQKETAKTLHCLLHDLAEPYKEVFSLRVFGELPFAQIGELFGKSDSWARLIFYRAKNKLREELDEHHL